MASTTASKLDKVSKNCLRGRPVPRALAQVWAAVDDDDDYLSDQFEIALLTSLDALEDGYGEAIARESDEIAANVRAHHSVFERLGFFAEGPDGDLLAFDFESGPADNPPVVKLDSEGQYEWLGIDLAEALLRIAEDQDELESMQEWLDEREIAHAELAVFGATTQFLPSIGDLHTRRFYANLDEPRPELPSSPTPATDADPGTWLLRPASEVAAVLARVLAVPTGGRFDTQWVSCDGQGRVTGFWLRPTGGAAKLRVDGVGFGDSRGAVIDKLGPPAEDDADSANWRRGPGWLCVTFDDGQVCELSVHIPDAAD